MRGILASQLKSIPSRPQINRISLARSVVESCQVKQQQCTNLKLIYHSGKIF